jgi:hypothetical protein
VNYHHRYSTDTVHLEPLNHRQWQLLANRWSHRHRHCHHHHTRPREPPPQLHPLQPYQMAGLHRWSQVPPLPQTVIAAEVITTTASVVAGPATGTVLYGCMRVCVFHTYTPLPSPPNPHVHVHPSQPVRIITTSWSVCRPPPLPLDKTCTIQDCAFYVTRYLYYLPVHLEARHQLL